MLTLTSQWRHTCMDFFSPFLVAKSNKNKKTAKNVKNDDVMGVSSAVIYFLLPPHSNVEGF